ncbi:MAG: hypothetical protein ACI308_04570 [Muribaculaceae bacterium]
MKLLLCLCLWCMMPSAAIHAQDNLKGSWMTEAAVQTDDYKEVANFLKSLNGCLRPMAVRYGGEVIESKTTLTSRATQVDNSSWRCRMQVTAASREALSFNLQFSIESGECASAGVAAAFDFGAWSRDNFVLIPAYVYNGNRFNVETDGYMGTYPAHYINNPQVPAQLFSNSPRLALAHNTPGKIEGLTGNASTPAMCFFSPEKKRAFILLFEQESQFGNNGMFVEENAAQDRASFVVSAPGVRELRAGFGDFFRSGDRGTLLKAGDVVNMRFCIYSFAAQSKTDLYDRWMQVRKSLTGANHPRNLTPFSQTVSLTTQFKNSYRWAELPFGSFYRTGNCDGFLPGWVGGLINTYALIATNDALSRERALKTIDFALTRFQAPSGYFYSSNSDNGTMGAPDRPEAPRSSLVRRNADVLYWMIKQFELLKLQGHGSDIRPEWESAMLRLADALASTWQRYGQFGHYVDFQNGDIIIYNSASGALAPGALAVAGHYFGRPDLVSIARQSARRLYQREVEGLGFTSGACTDIMQDADSESNFAFTESLMALYELTADPQWLQRACHVANMASTWVVSYDYRFPLQSTIGRLGGHMAGSVWASTQNKHAAPGICTMSADHLFKLYRATGNTCYADLLRDICHAHAEVMETPGRPTTGMGAGSSMERIQLDDAEGKSEIGMILHTSNGWTEGNGMLMAIEIPGIYVQKDKGNVYVFDHVTVKTLKRTAHSVTLEITNPTRFDADVAVFAENSADAAKPLGFHAHLNWQKVTVEAGKTRVITL